MDLRHIINDDNRKCTRFEVDVENDAPDKHDWTLSIYRTDGNDKLWFVDLLGDSFMPVLAFEAMTDKENNDLRQIAKRAMYMIAEYNNDRVQELRELNEALSELYGQVQ